VHRSSLSVANNTDVTVSWTSEEVDEASYFDSGTPTVLTVADPGWCMADALTFWAADLDGARITEIFYTRSGVDTVLAGDYSGQVGSSTRQRFTASGTFLAEAGDTVWVRVFHNAGNALTLNAARLSLTCDNGPGGGGGPVTIEAFSDQALDYVQLAIFALVVIGGFVLLMLAWIAVQGMRR